MTTEWSLHIAAVDNVCETLVIEDKLCQCLLYNVGSQVAIALSGEVLVHIGNNVLDHSGPIAVEFFR